MIKSDLLKKYLYDKKLLFLSLILGLIWSLLINFSHQLNTYSCTNIRMLLLPTIVIAIVIAIVIGIFWKLLEKLELKLSTANKSNWFTKAMDWLCCHAYTITLILFLCWLPCFLGDFPGGFRHDAFSEFDQVQTNMYNPAFPKLHTVIITRFLPFMYNLTGTYNSGIAIYVIVQMILLAVLYTHIIKTFYKKGIHQYVLGIVFLYMALFPTIHMLVEFSGRDMLFTGLSVYTLFLVYELITDKGYFFSSFKNSIILAMVLPLTMYSRNNGSKVGFLVAYLVIVGIILVLNFKAHSKKVITFAICTVALFVSLGFSLNALCQPTYTNNKTERESLGFFAQTLARAFIYDIQEWSEEDLTELCKYSDPGLLGLYTPMLYDTARNSLFIAPETRKDFKAFWWRIGKKHPGAYLDAYLITSQPAWDPTAILYGYTKATDQGYYGKEKQYFSINPESEEQPAQHVDILPVASRYYQWIAMDISFDKIPIFRLIFAIGFHFWFVMNAFFYLIYRRMKKLILPVTVVLVYACICTFVPIVLVRYFALLFFETPIILTFVLEPNKASKSR